MLFLLDRENGMGISKGFSIKQIVCVLRLVICDDNVAIFSCVFLMSKYTFEFFFSLNKIV